MEGGGCKAVERVKMVERVQTVNRVESENTAPRINARTFGCNALPAMQLQLLPSSASVHSPELSG